MTKHTATPWHATKESEIGFDDNTIRITERPHYGGKVIASIWENEEQKNNAAFIVTACNSHDELLANIDAVLYTVEMNRGDLSGSARQALDNLRAVVNKARGES